MDVGDYRILLVDNNVNDAKIIKRYLQRHSEAIIVDYAPDADRCYRKLIEHVYDLLLIDCNLPDGDCAEMVKELREIDVFSPIIVIAGESQADKGVEAVKAGADGYVTKSAEGLRKLPRLAEKQIKEYQKRFVASEEYKEKRLELYQNKLVIALLGTLHDRNMRHVAPRIHTSYGYSTDAIPGLGIPKDKMQKLLNLLTHYRILHRTRIGMRVTCVSCSSDDVSPVFLCPNCGSEAFSKTRRMCQCEGICGERFTEPRTVYGCNDCGERFALKDGGFEPVFIYSVNDDLKQEIKETVNAIRQLKEKPSVAVEEKPEMVVVTES